METATPVRLLLSTHAPLPSHFPLPPRRPALDTPKYNGENRNAFLLRLLENLCDSHLTLITHVRN